MAGFDREKFMQQLEQLRQVMGEDAIFFHDDEGRIRLTREASLRLADMQVAEARERQDKLRAEASAAAARLLTEFPGGHAA
jgi:hypothetical protein